MINLKLEHMYGPKDDSSKFIQFVIENLLRNAEKIELTKGEQKRDFIFIEDVVEAYIMLIHIYSQLSENFSEFELGTGKLTRIKDLVIRIKELIGNNQTKLKFGALPYRKNEIMESKADISKLLAFGWEPKYSLEKGLKLTVDWHKDNLR